MNKQLSFFEKESKTLEEIAKNVENIAPIKVSRKRVNPQTYQNFYENGEKLGRGIGENTSEKRKLLEKYFPLRFGEKGNQSLKNKNNVQIGSTFNHLIEYSQKYINQ